MILVRLLLPKFVLEDAAGLTNFGSGALVFASAFLYKPPNLTHPKDLSALCARVSV